MNDDKPRCPRCERPIRLTTKGAIGKHDRSAFQRRSCAASGHNYLSEETLLLTQGRQPA